MLIDQISLQPYDVGTIIIPIFTNEETEEQGLSNLLNLGNDETGPNLARAVALRWGWASLVQGPKEPVWPSLEKLGGGACMVGYSVLSTKDTSAS